MVDLQPTIDRIEIAISKLRLPQPLFSLQVGWAADYESLFRGDYNEETDASELLRRLSYGRLLISARGGGAKTIMLRRIAKEAHGLGTIPLLVSLNGWTGRTYQLWRGYPSNAARLDYLLSTFSLVPVSALTIEEIDPAKKKLILLDGLNEVNFRTGQDLLYILDEYVSFAPNTAVIVTDRLVRRSFDSDRWQLAGVLPLSKPEVEKHIAATFGSPEKYHQLSPDSHELLSSPYFLDMFLRDATVKQTRSEEFRAYFLSHVLNADEINTAAMAAFEAYKSRSRTFATSEFIAHTGQDIFRKLHDSGAIVIEGPVAYFDHHLKHDYLVSLYLATHAELWNDETFKIVTFGASSFEAVTLALEQTDSRESADSFLRKVYDWNIYGAGTALADARKSLVSDEMQAVILAMFAERRWDLLAVTAQKATDTLQLFRTAMAVRFRSANSFEEIFALLRELQTTVEWFVKWREIYAKTRGSQAEQADLERLTDRDSVVGWTSSNVLKRLQLSQGQQLYVRQLLGRPEAVIRWRAAHVLGAFPSRENVGSLAAALADESASVRYGAVRSLVEMAARSHDLADRIFSEIMVCIDHIAEHSSTVEEFQRAIVLKDNARPPNWRELVLPVAIKLQSMAVTMEQIEEWNRVLKALIPK